MCKGFIDSVGAKSACLRDEVLCVHLSVVPIGR